jgi:hypothetical protein
MYTTSALIRFSIPVSHPYILLLILVRSKGACNGSGIRNALQKAVVAEHNPISVIW